MKDLLTLGTVKEKLDLLKGFIYSLGECISNVDEIIKAQRDGVFLKPIELFVGHYVFLCYSYCSINCHKIFAKDEKTGILNLLNRIENSRYDNDFRSLFSKNIEEDIHLISSKEMLITVSRELKDCIEEKAELIRKISSRRSKFYAHTDPDANNVERETLDELRELKLLAESIFHQLYGRLFGVHVMFEPVLASVNGIISDRKFVDNYYHELEVQLRPPHST